MKNQAEIQSRYLQENPQMRLGHLASDLARAASFMQIDASADAIKSVVEESKFFAEWTAPDVELEIQTILTEIQSFLSQTQREWDFQSKKAEWRKEVTQKLRSWSDELLRRSGLIDSNE